MTVEGLGKSLCYGRIPKQRTLWKTMHIGILTTSRQGSGPPEVAWALLQSLAFGHGGVPPLRRTRRTQVFTLHGEKDYAQASGTFLRNGKALHLQDWRVSATSHLQCIKAVVMMCYSRVMSPLLCTNMQEPSLPTGWLWCRPVDPELFRSGQHPIAPIQVPRRADGCMKWASEGTRLSLLHVEMLKFGGYGPKTGRTGAKHAKHPRAGPLDVVASFNKEIQGNLHSKHWLLLLPTPIPVPFWGALCTAKAQSC